MRRENYLTPGIYQMILDICLAREEKIRTDPEERKRYEAFLREQRKMRPEMAKEGN